MSEAETTALRLLRAADGAARRWLEAGGPAGAVPLVAASVCLLQDATAGTGRAGPEVLWLTRGRRLTTWPGVLAFPGGVVETRDRARRPDDAGHPDRFTVLARAAARECEEESGVPVSPRGLRAFARWVTPEHEPRRFDTTFLVGTLPDGRVSGSGDAGAAAAAAAAGEDGEVHEHGWAAPEALLAEVAAGRRQALPPTRAVLRALQVAGGQAGGQGAVSAAEAADALVRAGSLVPVVPRAAWHDGPVAEDGLLDVDLLLPRHAGDVP